ncbi:MAG: hypothetical protein RLP44_09295 [Aggregatilineales bacterium]
MDTTIFEKLHSPPDTYEAIRLLVSKNTQPDSEIIKDYLVTYRDRSIEEAASIHEKLVRYFEYDSKYMDEKLQRLRIQHTFATLMVLIQEATDQEALEFRSWKGETAFLVLMLMDLGSSLQEPPRIILSTLPLS